MNKEIFEEKMEHRFHRHRSRTSKAWTGVALLIIGGALFARAAGVPLPNWIFSWPMILIAVGIFSGLNHKFRPGGWMFPLLIGSVFLFDRMNDTLYLRPYLWPAILIIAGAYIILKPSRTRSQFINNDAKTDVPNSYEDTSTTSTLRTNEFAEFSDVLDITTVFSGVKKRVVSKNFKGGDLVTIMGGADIDLTQADYVGHIKIDSFTMFGGVKLIVPPDWNIQSDVVAIFGGVEDKRPPATNHDPSKIIHLDGTCIFGGIEIKSF